MESYGVGRWNMTFALYDHAEMLEARIAVVEKAFAMIAGARVTVTRYAGDAEPEDLAYGHRITAGIPDMSAAKPSFWSRGRGGPVSFAPERPLGGVERRE